MSITFFKISSYKVTVHPARITKKVSPNDDTFLSCKQYTNYSLTAPAPRPVTIDFCEKINIITSGTATVNAPAANVVN